MSIYLVDNRAFFLLIHFCRLWCQTGKHEHIFSMESFSLAELKSLNRASVEALYGKLGLSYPPEADLEYLRSNLRMLKLRSDKVDPANDSNTSLYANQDIVSHELGKVREDPIYDTVETNERINTNTDIINTTPQKHSVIDSLSNKHPILNMTEKIPCFQPRTFSGAPTENVEVFLSIMRGSCLLMVGKVIDDFNSFHST